MATYTYTSSRYEDNMFKTFTVTVPLTQMEGETDQDYMYRIFGTAVTWLTQVSDADIPDGHPRNIRNQLARIRVMTDDDLLEDIDSAEEAADRNDNVGVWARTRLDLLNMEWRRRTGARN